MTTLLRAADSAGFLSMVPSLAGFTPRQSIVLLPFHGTRTSGAMRLDLPDGIPLDEYADAAVGLVSRVEGTDAIALVVYTDEPAHPTRDGLVLPLAVAVDAVLGCAEDAGLRIVDALCVTAGGWSSYLIDEPELRSLDEIRSGPVVPSLGDVTGDQLSGTALPSCDLVEGERVGRALQQLTRLLDGEHDGPTGDEDPGAVAALLLLDDIPVFFEAILGMPDDQPPFATAALLWCLERPLLRDVAIAQWAGDLSSGRRTLDAQLTFSATGRMVPDDIGDVFLGRGGMPDPDRLARALAAVRTAAARAPRAFRPAPLTAAAWLSWALGRSSHAGHYLDSVRAIDPEYGLAALIGTMIDAAMLPEWAFRRRPTTDAQPPETATT